jgi:hypothetical protein
MTIWIKKNSHFSFKKHGFKSWCWAFTSQGPARTLHRCCSPSCRPKAATESANSRRTGFQMLECHRGGADLSKGDAHSRRICRERTGNNIIKPREKLKCAYGTHKLHDERETHGSQLSRWCGRPVNNTRMPGNWKNFLMTIWWRRLSTGYEFRFVRKMSAGITRSRTGSANHVSMTPSSGKSAVMRKATASLLQRCQNVMR